MRSRGHLVTLALAAGLCALAAVPAIAGAAPSEAVVSETLYDPSTSADQSDPSDSAKHTAPGQKPTQPTHGTACIIDSQGRVTRLRFQGSPGGFDHEGWLERTKEFERRLAEARAENERLRLQWIAEERQRAIDEAERQATLDAEVRRNRGGDYGWILGGYNHQRPHGGHGGRPRPPAKAATRPRPEPSKPIFLPTPNLTSPFPHSSTRNPNSANKSFLP